MAAGLGETELDAETHDVRHDDDGQHLQETEPQRLPERGHDALREEVLITGVVETEQQSGHQRHDDDDHRTFHVVAVADVRATRSGGVRHEEESLERIERRGQEAQLASLGEGGLEVVHYFTQSHRYASLIIKLIPSRMICWIPIFEGSTNSHNAKSSSTTS